MDIEAYVEQLRSDPRELNALYEDLLIGVTRFFRDDAAFDALQERIIPAIVDGRSPPAATCRFASGCRAARPGRRPIRSRSCSTRRCSRRRRPLNVKILATDVHQTSLEVAGAGRLQRGAGGGHQSRAPASGSSPGRANGYQVSQSLRQLIVFAPHNLIRDAPFTKLDLISCRNLLIYFQPHAQKTVLTLFHFGLKTGGSCSSARARVRAISPTNSTRSTSTSRSTGSGATSGCPRTCGCRCRALVRCPRCRRSDGAAP